jgi:hypothetical protein
MKQIDRDANWRITNGGMALINSPLVAASGQ